MRTRCKSCEGSGKALCPQCKGKGRIPGGAWSESTACEHCAGAGYVGACPACQGTGGLTVDVPPDPAHPGRKDR